MFVHFIKMSLGLLTYLWIILKHNRIHRIAINHNFCISCRFRKTLRFNWQRTVWPSQSNFCLAFFMRWWFNYYFVFFHQIFLAHWINVIVNFVIYELSFLLRFSHQMIVIGNVIFFDKFAKMFTNQSGVKILLCAWTQYKYICFSTDNGVNLQLIEYF